MSKLFRVVVAVGLIATMMASNVAAVWAATPPEPTYGTADVDGDYSEWDLSNDFFAKMYRAADPDKQVESKLYLRYDCSSGTLYALVLAEPDVTILANLPDDSFIKLGNSTKLVDGNSGDNGTPPDFAWVGRSGNIASGWEASAQLAVGSYTNLNVHTQVNDGGQQTSAVEDRAIDLMIDCTGLASLGDYVWYDVNMNGLQDAGESGLDGVTVNLYDSSHNPKGTTTTSGGGLYTFTNLEPGDYYVEFVLPNDDYSFSLQDQGSNDAVDSDADPTTGKTVVTTLLAGETDLTWDAGLHLCDIGDRVWHDESGGGDQNNSIFPPYDPEPGFNDVDVYLYDYQPSTCGEDGYLAMTTTISGTSQTPDDWPNGIYGFDMTLHGTGDYWVCVDESTLPSAGEGMHWKRTSGIHTTGDNPQKVTYTGSDDFSIDFGYEKEADPTAVTLSTFAAKPGAGSSVSPLWLGVAGLTGLVAGSLFWVKRRAS
jgi:hypothetical protein